MKKKYITSVAERDYLGSLFQLGAADEQTLVPTATELVRTESCARLEEGSGREAGRKKFCVVNWNKNIGAFKIEKGNFDLDSEKMWSLCRYLQNGGTMFR